MAERVCPWWMGYFLLTPIRKLFENPRKILSPFVKKGMNVLEPGCGMGFFTLEAARLAGPGGGVYAVDLQQKMISALERRVRRAKLTDVVAARVCPADTLGVSDLDGSIDIALAFCLVHEVPDAGRFFGEVRRALRPGGRCLVIEPVDHVSEEDFEATLETARGVGFSVAAGPYVRRNHTAVLESG
ncbi:MAG: class I SAM-dependent methyltransferase [Candidatus Krumholzibacteria bacterium]|nr:class I SAM-dependent methyltransferase [Candidatus Krumholzibacteria bacterium]